MPIHQDFLMRQIEIMARMLAKLIFDKDTAEYIILHEEGFSEAELVLKELVRMISDRKINEAENLLFEYIRAETAMNEANPDMPEERIYLEIAIDFYSRVNKLSDKILEVCGFGRDEIEDGVKEIASIYNYNLI